MPVGNYYQNEPAPQIIWNELPGTAFIWRYFVGKTKAVELPMSIDGNNLNTTAVYGVVSAFTDISKSVFFQIFDKTTPTDGNKCPHWLLARVECPQWEPVCPDHDRQGSFHEGHRAA